ncbi:hypothetical protein OpiT1DRAFT_03959 [Opitutaceae bacterium TAV1]|nr:hypothetical protein OpiT1DRAFT_03959 [Opitutaceae bacterium TAV1]
MSNNLEIRLTLKPILDGLDTFVAGVRTQLEALGKLTDGLRSDQQALAKDTKETAVEAASAMRETTAATEGTDVASGQLVETVGRLHTQMEQLGTAVAGLQASQQGAARQTGETAAAVEHADTASGQLVETLDRLNTHLDRIAKSEAPKKQEEQARALERTDTAARQATGGLRGFLQTLRERVGDVKTFNQRISNGDVALRKWMALFSGAGLVGLLRNYAQQAREAEQEQRLLAAQIGEAAAKEQIAAQSKNDYTRATLGLGRAINDAGRALQSVFTPVLSALTPILSAGASTAQAFAGAVGPIAPGAIAAAAGLLVLPRAISAVTAVINPLRTLVFALTGQTISQIHTLVTRMTQTQGTIKGWFSVVAGGTKSLEAFGRAALVAAGPLAALGAFYAVGQTAANLYVKSVEEAARKEQELANSITARYAAIVRGSASIRDQKGATAQLAAAQKELASTQTKIDALTSKKAASDAAYAPSASIEERMKAIGQKPLDGAPAGFGKPLPPVFTDADKRALTEAQQLLTGYQTQIRRLTDEREVAATTARNLAADEAKAEQARIDALVGRLPEIRDLAADLDFQKLSPQGQFAALGFQIDALKGQLASLPAPDTTSREAVNRHLAQQLDLENQIAKAEASRAQITKTLDAEEKEAAEKTLRARRDDLAARETLQRSILDQIRHEQTLVATREDLTPTQKQEAFNELLKRQQATLAEIIRLKKEEIGLASNPAEIARLEAEIADLKRQLDDKGPSAPGKLATQRQNAAAIESGTSDQHYNGFAEGFEGAYLSQVEQLGTAGDRIAEKFANVAGSIRTSLGSAFTDMLWRGEYLRDAMAEFGSAIAQSFIGNTAQMVADWIYQHTIMAAWKALTEAKVTAAAATGAAARTGIVVGEETAATTAKATGTAARTGFSLAEAGKNIISAATGAMSAMASIPYVGPILAIAAMGAIVAAGVALIQSFATGGLVRGPGTGTSDSVPARLSDGEYVVRSAAVDYYGTDLMDAINAGALDLSAGVEAIPAPLTQPSTVSGGGSYSSTTTDAGAGGGQPAVNLNVAFFNTQGDARAWAESQEGQTMLIDMQRQNRAAAGIRT